MQSLGCVGIMKAAPQIPNVTLGSSQRVNGESIDRAVRAPDPCLFHFGETERQHLIHLAEQLIVRRSLPGVWIYPIMTLALAFSTPLGKMYPGLTSGFSLLTIPIALARYFLASQCESIHELRPELWRNLFVAGVLSAAAMWSATSVSVGLLFGIGFAYFLALLCTAGIASASILVYAQNGWLLRSLLLILVFPHLVSVTLLGGQEGLGTALAITIFGAYLTYQSQEISHEFWLSLVDHRLLERRVEELEEARLRAEEANHRKEELLAQVSHEIRTPMTGVVGMTSLLLEGSLPREERGQVETIRTCGESLLTILDDISDLSKIDSGHLKIEEKPFDPQSLIEDSMDLLTPMAAEKGIELVCSIEEGTPATLVGDASRVRQILVQMLGDTIRCTHRRTVSIDLETRSLGRLRFELHFTVRDSGLRIPRDHLEHLSSDASPSGSTGLGLAVCRRLTEVMGGAIWTESEAGGGAAFHFTVIGQGSPPRRAPSPTIGRPLRLLLAEDNVINQKVASMMLESLGLRADLATSGAEALEAVARQPYDVVLMDVQMPEMNGLEATRRLVELYPAHRRPYIIGMSAHATASDREAAIAVGMDTYLSKPIRFEKLEAALLSLAAPATTKTTPRAWDTEVSAVIDEAQLGRLLELDGENTSPGDSLVATYLTRVGNDLRAVEKALADDDRLGLARAAFNLKGSSTHLGARGLATTCSSLEDLAPSAPRERLAALERQVKNEMFLVREKLSGSPSTSEAVPS